MLHMYAEICTLRDVRLEQWEGGTGDGWLSWQVSVVSIPMANKHHLVT